MTRIERFLKKIRFSGSNNYGESSDIHRYMDLFRFRDYCIQKYGFAILTENMIGRLKEYAPIVEIGAGLGYWAWEFQKRGIEYVATDKEPCCSHYFKGTYFNYNTNKEKKFPVKAWTDIEPIDAVEAVKKYSNHTALVCWPGYGDEWAVDALKAYSGNIFIYVGEGSGGCTANDEFHEILYTDWEETEVPIPQWFGIHDYISINERKTNG